MKVKTQATLTWWAIVLFVLGFWDVAGWLTWDFLRGVW